MELKNTVDLMMSADYKNRFIAEFEQTRIRYVKLKRITDKFDKGKLEFELSCPRSIYELQLEYMRKYLSVLEARAKIEGIKLAGLSALQAD